MSTLSEAKKQEVIAEILTTRADRSQFILRMQQRQQEGIAIAQQCAQFLKEKYGVSKVVLFGSLLNPEKMSSHSDIDLAVWDLPEKDYFKAIGYLLEISEEFSIDLVEIQHAKPYILVAIEQGIELCLT